MRPFFFLSLASLLLLSQRTLAASLDWPIHDSPKHWLVDSDSLLLSLDSTYTRTTENYSPRGGRSLPFNLSEATAFNNRLHGGLEFGPRFSLFAQGSFRRVEDSVVDGGGSLPKTFSRWGLGDFFLAARWLVYSSSIPGGRFATADVIAPGNFRLLLEGGVSLSPYSLGRPPLGDRTKALQSMARLAWFPFSQFAFSLGAGYTLRTGVYAAEIPYSLRLDYFIIPRLRAFFDFHGWEGATTTDPPLGQFTSQSLLYTSPKSSIGKLRLGLAGQITKDFELAAAYERSLNGKNSAREESYSIGIAYSPPAEVTTSFFNPRRDLEIGGLAVKNDYEGYSWATPIVKVTKSRRFFRIGRGAGDGVKMDDEFHVFLPARLTPEGPKPEKFIARGVVVRLSPDGASLKVRAAYQAESVSTLHEARHVKRSVPEAPRKILR